MAKAGRSDREIARAIREGEGHNMPIASAAIVRERMGWAEGEGSRPASILPERPTDEGGGEGQSLIRRAIRRGRGAPPIQSGRLPICKENAILEARAQRVRESRSPAMRAARALNPDDAALEALRNDPEFRANVERRRAEREAAAAAEREAQAQRDEATRRFLEDFARKEAQRALGERIDRISKESPEGGAGPVMRRLEEGARRVSDVESLLS